MAKEKPAKEKAIKDKETEKTSKKKSCCCSQSNIEA